MGIRSGKLISQVLGVLWKTFTRKQKGGSSEPAQPSIP
jgi:hypothetical protein